MTDMNAAYIVVLETSQREDVDKIKDAISHIKGVISVTPIPEDIPEHIAEERIAHEFSEKFNEMSCLITSFLCERIARGQRHNKNLKDAQNCIKQKNSEIRRCSECGFVLDDKGSCQNVNCEIYQWEPVKGTFYDQ